MIRTVISALVAAVALPIALSPAAAADPVATWTRAVDAQVDHLLVMPSDGGAGTAALAFRRSPSGRAVDIVARGSSFEVRLAALRTAARLRDLPPLPVGMDPRARVEMRLLFGELGEDTRFEHDRVALERHAAATNVQLASRLAGTGVVLASAER